MCFPDYLSIKIMNIQITCIITSIMFKHTNCRWRDWGILFVYLKCIDINSCDISSYNNINIQFYSWQALREELVRQRTSMLSNGCGDSVYNPEKAMQDALQMKKLEDHVIRCVYSSCWNHVIRSVIVMLELCYQSCV